MDWPIRLTEEECAWIIETLALAERPAAALRLLRVEGLRVPEIAARLCLQEQQVDEALAEACKAWEEHPWPRSWGLDWARMLLETMRAPVDRPPTPATGYLPHADADTKDPRYARIVSVRAKVITEHDIGMPGGEQWWRADSAVEALHEERNKQRARKRKKETPVFNEEQQAHMRYLATLAPEEKCACGWARRGDCFGPCYGQSEKGGAKTPVQRREEILERGGKPCEHCGSAGYLIHQVGTASTAQTCPECNGKGELLPAEVG